jgi:hypothetical protein
MQYMGLDFLDSFVISVGPHSDQFAARDVLSALRPLYSRLTQRFPRNGFKSFVRYPEGY